MVLPTWVGISEVQAFQLANWDISRWTWFCQDRTIGRKFTLAMVHWENLALKLWTTVETWKEETILVSQLTWYPNSAITGVLFIEKAIVNFQETVHTMRIVQKKNKSSFVSPSSLCPHALGEKNCTWELATCRWSSLYLRRLLVQDWQHPKFYSDGLLKGSAYFAYNKNFIFKVP